jgi:hypothetical protein
MALPHPKGFNRRQLLGSAAGLVTVGVALDIDAARGADPAEVADLGNPELIPPPLNVRAATARRIAEIARRNRIREEAGLPLLSITKELRRMKRATDAAEFEAFAEVHSRAVWDEVLSPEREQRGQADWRPKSFMEGLRFQSQVSRLLHQRFALETS